MSIVARRSKRPVCHDKLVPRTGVCNLCRGVAGFDSRTTHKHHNDRIVKNPHCSIIELCELCHYYVHAIAGTGHRNAPSSYDYAYKEWLKHKNNHLELISNKDIYLVIPSI